MNWKFWQKPTVTKVELVRIRTNTIRLAKWRQVSTLVAESARLAKDPHYMAQLDVLRTENPANLHLPALGTSPDDRAAHQAKIEGYNLCLNNLEAFAMLHKPKEALIETFEPPEK